MKTAVLSFLFYSNFYLFIFIYLFIYFQFSLKIIISPLLLIDTLTAEKITESFTGKKTALQEIGEILIQTLFSIVYDFFYYKSKITRLNTKVYLYL